MSDSSKHVLELTRELVDLTKAVRELQSNQSRLLLNFLELRDTVAALKGQAVPLPEPLSPILRGQCVITPFPRGVGHA
ncbi:MAG: hypothetical protein IJD16_09120 [Desulfovibrio sp.]|nr:hypothetical protein [Desulfovibrio sp.]